MTFLFERECTRSKNSVQDTIVNDGVETHKGQLIQTNDRSMVG